MKKKIGKLSPDDYTLDRYEENENIEIVQTDPQNNYTPDVEPYEPETPDVEIYEPETPDVEIYEPDPEPNKYDDDVVPEYPENPKKPDVKPDVDPETLQPNVLFSNEIKNLLISIQCKFANAYTQPRVNPGLCIISYDRDMLKLKGSKDNNIGKLTGNYFQDENGTMWLESSLFHCNRRNIGWFREMNIWHPKKGTDKPEEPITPSTNKKTWMAWIATGLTALSFLR